MKPILHQLILAGLLLLTTMAAVAQSVPRTTPTSINVTSICPGGQIILSADVTDDGLLGVRETPDGGGKYWVSYYNSSTGQLALDFQTYNEVYTGTVTKRSSGVYTASNKISGPITIPSTLPAGSYYVRIFVGEQNSRLNPNNAGNSPTFTVYAPATVVISDAVAGGVTINPGQAAPVKLTFGGSGAFTFNYEDLRNPGFSQTVSVLTAGSTTINVYPTTTYTFDASKLINFRGACDNGIRSGQATITVNALTVKTTSATPAVVCPNRDPIVVSFSTNGTPPSGTTYTVLISDASGNFQPPTAGILGNIIGTGSSSPITCSAGRPISAYKAGAYKVRVISNNNNIQADGSSVAVTLSRTTSPAVTEVSYCENAPISLQTGVVGSNLFWYGIKYNGGDYGSYKVGENQAATPPSPTTPGVYTYQVTQSSGGCESDIAELKVTVKPKSSPPGNQTVEYCQGSGTKTLTVNAQNPIWYNSAGASLGTTAPTISTDNATPLTYKVTQNTNGCVSDQSTITVNIRAKPAPPTVNTPADVCQFATPVTLSANGQSLQWYNSDGSPRGDAPTPTGGGTAPQTFFVTQTVNGCTSDKATIVQKFIAAPAKPTVANPNPQACQNEPPVQLAASATGTLNWYDFQSKLLANTPAQPTSVTPGTYTYFVSQSAGGCESERVKIEVLIKSKSPAPGDATVDFCQLTGNQTLTINAQNPTWYTSNGTATGASAPIINTDNASPQTYKVAQNTNGCLSDQSTITVNIKPKPSPPTVSDPKVLCQFGPTAELTAGGQNLQWFANDDTPLTSPVKPNTDGIASLVFKVVQTVNGCASDKATLTQKINPASDKPTVTPGFYCVGYPAEPISARTPASTQGPKWYQGGSEIAPTTVPKTDQVATFTYQLTQTQADKQGCPSQPVNVVISILATPLAPSVNNLGLCNNRPATVTLDSRVSGQKLTWYETPTGGTGSQTTPKPDVSVVGPKTYYVTQTNEGNCESPRSPLIVTIYPIPAAPKGTVSGSVCQTSGQPQPIGAFASTPDPGGTLTWYWSDQLAGAPQPPTSSATAQPGSFTVAVAQTINGCISLSTTITQTINKAPNSPKGADLLLCLKDAPRPLTATPDAGNTLRWYGKSEKGGTSSSTPPTVTPDGVKTEIYYVSQVDANGCESLLPRLAIKLTVAEVPPAPTIPSVTTACQNTNPISLTAGASASLIWKGTDITDTTKAPTPPTTAERVFSYTLTQKLGSCISPASSFTYQIIKEPDAPSAQASYQVCVGQSWSLSATASPATNTLKWYTSQLDATNRANALLQVAIPTDKKQTLSWYVTQTDPHGCQSKTVLQTATVSQQASAKLTGDDRVVYDDNLHSQDSTAIRIAFDGDGPWNVTFWDGKTALVNASQNPFVKWVKLKDIAGTTPVNSQTVVSFPLQALTGQCGQGSLTGATYSLTLRRLVTDVEPLAVGLSLQVLPNPASSSLRVEWQAKAHQGVRLRVLSSSGSVLWQADRVGSGVVEVESLPVTSWSSGQYYVQMADEKGSLAVRKLLKQ